MKKCLSYLLASSILLSSVTSFASTEQNLKFDQAARIELQTSLMEKSMTLENILREPEINGALDNETREELIQLSQDMMDASENPESVKKSRKFKKIAIGVVQGIGLGLHTTVVIFFTPLLISGDFVTSLVIGESKKKSVQAAGDIAEGGVVLSEIYLMTSFIPLLFQVAVVAGFASIPGELVCLISPEKNQKFCGKMAKIDHLIVDQLSEKGTNAGLSLNKKIKKLYRKVFPKKTQTVL